MPKRRDINKVKAVAKIYMNNGMDMTKALKEVEANNIQYKDPTSIHVKAHYWRIAPEIQAQIKAELALFDEKIADRVYCIANLVDIINNKDTKASDRIQAINTIAKLIGYADNVAGSVNVQFNINDLKTIPVKSTVIDVPNNSQQSATNAITT